MTHPLFVYEFKAIDCEQTENNGGSASKASHVGQRECGRRVTGVQ
jgi:hypothetical protein